MAKKSSVIKRAFASVAAAAALFTMAGCSSLPVSGGNTSPLNSDDQQNAQLCLTFEQAQAKAASIAVGTPKIEVYSAFGLKVEDETKTLRLLTKEEVNRSLYGQQQLEIPFEKRADAQNFANSLEGHAITCESVHSARKYGFTHTEVEKTGYAFTLTFIFNKSDGKLYDPVNIAGAPVKQRNSTGYLNSFNPVDVGLKAARGGL